jgi:hypothetical protein
MALQCAQILVFADISFDILSSTVCGSVIRRKVWRHRIYPQELDLALTFVVPVKVFYLPQSANVSLLDWLAM